MFEATGPVKTAAVAAVDADTLVAAVSGKRLRVISYVLSLTAAGAVKLQSNTTDITGAISAGANAPFAASYNPAGHCDTAQGEALKIDVTGGGTVNGHITYQEVL